MHDPSRQLGQEFRRPDPRLKLLARVPLIIANRRLFPEPVKIESLARQIDLAPTLLGLLGLNAPAEWQGQDLFSARPPVRIYCFAEHIYGLVEGNFKFLYDATLKRAELYDLRCDPEERHNLIGDPAYSKQAEQARLRLAAWAAFQNGYLDKLMRAGPLLSRTSLPSKIAPEVP